MLNINKKKFHILFLVHTYHPLFDANSLNVRTISQEFIKHGHLVSVIDQNYNTTLKMNEKFEGVNIYRSHDSISKSTLIKLVKAGNIKKCLFLLTELVKIKLKVRTKKLSFMDTFFLTSLLKEVINKKKINLVIPVCYPFKLNYPVMQLKTKNQLACKWIIYMQEPYSTHPQERDKKEISDIKKFERKAIENSNAVIVTDLVYEEFQRSSMKRYLKKMFIVPYPKIVKPFYEAVPDDIEINKKFINYVFLGGLNDNTRNPDYLFKVFYQLQDPNVRLMIIGQNKSSFLKQYKDLLRDTLVIYDRISHQAAINVLSNSDVLINIGSIADNHLPSKLLEYISTGKPIINFYKIQNDPAISYMSKYDLSLNIYEKDTSIESAANAVRKFSKQVIGKKIEFDQIERVYKDSTPESVYSVFINIINKVVNE